MFKNVFMNTFMNIVHEHGHEHVHEHILSLSSTTHISWQFLQFIVTITPASPTTTTQTVSIQFKWILTLPQQNIPISLTSSSPLNFIFTFLLHFHYDQIFYTFFCDQMFMNMSINFSVTSIFNSTPSTHPLTIFVTQFTPNL